jgi:hypothetical protein
MDVDVCRDTENLSVIKNDVNYDVVPAKLQEKSQVMQCPNNYFNQEFSRTSLVWNDEQQLSDQLLTLISQAPTEVPSRDITNSDDGDETRIWTDL